MKPKMKQTDLSNHIDIWDAVINVLSGDFPEDDETYNEAFIVYNYYSEMESGGHESLFNWGWEDIQAQGISKYITDLTSNLEKIGAHKYGRIMSAYGEEMWRLFLILEHEEMDEDAFTELEQEFYTVINKPNDEYFNLSNQLEKLLESYFVKIHTDLFEVVEN
ncbi:DMP19 family protein [Viridibacillus arvi]|uniref:DMP19 family protein n=1 Tax=Viridibacillus arvi TaxID=263475 RepID=UPI003CFFECA4